VSKRNNDISQQIRKYLNGELDARAMHQLEKEAQNDPFLMEALEGYEKTGTDQQKNLDELYTRLEQRANKKQARIIPFRVIGIAASVLLFLGIGILWLANKHPYVPQLQKEKIVLSAPPKEKEPLDTLKQSEPNQTLTAAVATSKGNAKRYAPPVVSENLIAKNNSVASIPSAPPNADIVADKSSAITEYNSVAKNKSPDLL
jgi:hypothetical protein